MKTIFAVSSGALPSAVSIIRVSGPQTDHILTTLLGYLPEPRKMQYGALYSQNMELLDKGLSVYFPDDHSFTGEVSAEFHLHGSKAVVSRFLNELSLFRDTRLAEPGEFSKRAFLNKKMDLTQIEGLSDLIRAETELQRRLALTEVDGTLSRIYAHWRKELIEIRALIEAELDFSEEEDVIGGGGHSFLKSIHALNLEIKTYISQSEKNANLRDGIRVVLVGAPNSGKSSLMNQLAGRPVSIVSKEPGTTRDAVEIKLNLSGVPVLITDTAGIRNKPTTDIERLGIEITRSKVAHADLILLLEDMLNPSSVDLTDIKGDLWRVGNKKDLLLKSSNEWNIQISSLTENGIRCLLEKLSEYSKERFSQIGNLVPARHRQLSLLKKVVVEFDYILEESSKSLEILAEHLRSASHSLSKLTGHVDVEDLLDVIFSEFCIGK